MSTSAHIRILLAIVCGTFLLTAFVVKQTFTPKVNLKQTGGIVQKNINDRETYVNKFINNPAWFNELKHIPANPAATLQLIKDVTTDNRVWVYTFKGRELIFWSGIKILPESPEKYKAGANFLKMQAGDFLAIKKTDGDFTALFFIPVKNLYLYHNRYLKNAFDKSILQDDNVAIADFTDSAVYNIHSVNNSYLFSLKLKPNSINHRFFYFQLVLWLLGFFSLCILIHKTCTYIALKGYLYLSFLLLTTFICLTAFTYLRYNLPDLSDFKLFDPKMYSAGAFIPSLGYFCFNLLLACWLGTFIYHQRHRILKIPVSAGIAYVVTIFGSILIVGLAALLLKTYYGLVVRSAINFDVGNVFKLSLYSLMSILVLCFSFLLFYLINDTLLTIARKLPIPDKHKAIIFISVVAAVTLLTIILNNFTMFYLLAGVFTSMRAYAIWYSNGKLNAVNLLVILSLCALISAIELNYFQQVKDTDIRKKLIHKLEKADDPVAEKTFKNIEKRIVVDFDAIHYFVKPNYRNDDYLRDHFQKNYFDGYLSKYDLKMYAFDSTGKSITTDKSYHFTSFKDLVKFSAMKVDGLSYFYHDDKYGYQGYFAIFPIKQHNDNVGSIVIDLHAKPASATAAFPDLLVNSDDKPNNTFKDYSYAYYSAGQLISQTGQYAYKLEDTSYNCKIKTYTIKISYDAQTNWYEPMARYNHLIYRPDKYSTIVVSIGENPVEQIITDSTFFFLNFLIFSGTVVLIGWLWRRVRIYSIQNKQIKWGLRINLDKIAYRTRIQFSVMATVVFTLLLIGVISYQSINLQYQEQQNQTIRDKLVGLADIFRDSWQKGDYPPGNHGKAKFNIFADNYRTDLTLYNKAGDLLFTTQPKIYNAGLLARKMNGRAFIAMDKQHQSILLNDEKLGELVYKAAYVPVKGINNATEAYLQLPYFAKETDLSERSGQLLNAMINIYALVFIAVGLFAVLIARQITWPLQFVQRSIGKIIYGRKNEPIIWQRDDEIGALVNEYNKMIGQLEVSAQRLAQSERESAWREMAKQVAHEIKNPLTPLKLGLQLLDKAWKDKDPRFDQKFERFSKSFVEQIDSLSSIASEFSTFAKMPDTKLERVDLFDIIDQAVTIFKQMDNVTITYNRDNAFYINADRDQLMRCFNNLLKNAIEAIAIDKHGVITLTHKMEPNKVLVMLTDDGNGIPDTLREKIFMPNFTTKSSGTGLGLAFVKNSIENSGGKIWFETETGKGTTFFISWPVAV